MEPLQPAYSPLVKERKEIRLLHLAKKSDNSNPTGTGSHEAIQCSFSTVSLDQRPSYEALSYVWGELRKEKTITIDKRPVSITTNLFDAISQLQLQEKERTLWVDAVCINQADADERAHQVSQMQLIYERASKVVVYLGQAWKGSDEAMDFLEITGRDANIHYSPALSPHVVVGGVDTSSEELRDNIIQFFDLGWWKRVWTVQEFVLAQNIVCQCGTRTLSGDLLLNSFKNVNTHDNDCCSEETCFMTKSAKSGLCVWDGFTRMDMLAFMRTQRHSYSFLQTLSSFRGRQSYDPCDKIYGMLGLAAQSWAGLIKPDYTRTTGEIYRTVAFAAIEATGKLDFLSHCYGKRHLDLRLPSFVPDWTATVEEPSYASHLSRAFAIPYFDASRGTKAELKSITPETATSKGSIFDLIIKVGPSRIYDDSTTAGTLNTWRDLAQLGKVSVGQVPNRHPSEDGSKVPAVSKEADFWQTMCGGMGCDWDGSNHFWRRAVVEKDRPKYEKWQTWIAASHDPQLFDSDVGDFDNAHCAAANDRQFAVTGKGCIGFVPLAAKIGDAVAILAGADIPYILRTCQGRGPSQVCYSVVGDAYVHGIMDGDAFSQDELNSGDIHLV